MLRARPVTFKRAKVLRRSMTAPEVTLWSRLRACLSRFRRQHPMGDYILDFYCPAAKLAIEVDGEVHGGADQQMHDERRERRLASQGVFVLRFAARDIQDRDQLEGVVAEINRTVGERVACTIPPP